MKDLKERFGPRVGRRMGGDTEEQMERVKEYGSAPGKIPLVKKVFVASRSPNQGRVVIMASRR